MEHQGRQVVIRSISLTKDLDVVLNKFQNRSEAVRKAVSLLVGFDSSLDLPIISKDTLMENTSPALLTGLPGSGKTTFIRDVLIPDLVPPVLVVDVHNEYDSLKRISLGDFFGVDFSQENRKMRLVPSANVDVSKSEADTIFRHLIMFQRQLNRWVIVIEEGHRFSANPSLKSFLAESRKFVRKVLIVAHQARPFTGLCMMYKVSKTLRNVAAATTISASNREN